MTLAEFLAALRTCAGQYRWWCEADGVLYGALLAVAEPGEMDEICPIQAVGVSLTHEGACIARHYASNYAWRLARILRLPDDGAAIMDAADHAGGHDAVLRAQLLAAVGLTEGDTAC